jgi:predicted enzyme related to lactoylglutathione lyase
MTLMTDYPPGTFCWVDLATTDAEGAKVFYTTLFGWQASDVPAGEAGTYTMCEKDGMAVCALYPMGEEQRGEGIPPHWQSYVSVADVNESAATATAVGGTVLAEPFDVMEAGRMAVLRDPTGAVFAIWQPKEEIGARRVNEPGSFCWNELYTKDTAASERFYTALFGWRVKRITGATGQPYTEFRIGERPAAGMMEIQAEWGEVPPNWSVYFAVADCASALEQVGSLGGRIEMEPMAITGVGTFAVVQDPQGAHFLVIELQEGAA